MGGEETLDINVGRVVVERKCKYCAKNICALMPVASRKYFKGTRYPRNAVHPDFFQFKMCIYSELNLVEIQYVINLYKRKKHFPDLKYPTDCLKEMLFFSWGVTRLKKNNCTVLVSMISERLLQNPSSNNLVGFFSLIIVCDPSPPGQILNPRHLYFSPLPSETEQEF